MIWRKGNESRNKEKDEKITKKHGQDIQMKVEIKRKTKITKKHKQDIHNKELEKMKTWAWPPATATRVRDNLVTGVNTEK